MVNIDMWYGDDIKDVTKIDIHFRDVDCTYSGNFYIHDKIVGDYTAKSSVELEKKFPQLNFNWEG